MDNNEQLFDLELEKRILGNYLSNPQFRDMCINSGIHCDQFEDQPNRIIYYHAERICMERDDVDETTLIPELSKLKMSSLPWVRKYASFADQSIISYIGGKGYLLQLGEYSGENIFIHGQGWIDSFKDLFTRRDKIKRAQAMIEDLRKPNGQSISEIVSKFESGDVEQDQIKVYYCNESNQIFIDRLNRIKKDGKIITGISTGINEIDYRLGDLEPEWVVTISADPSSGKTSLATQIFQKSCLDNGNRSLYFSFEMNPEEMMGRFYSQRYEINMKRVKDGLINEYYDKITRGQRFFKDLPFGIIRDNGLSIDQIRSICRLEKRKNPDLKCIFLDHIGYIETHDRRVTHQHAINTYIAKTCKNMAKELGVVVFPIIQHKSEKRGKINKDSEYISPLPHDMEYGAPFYQASNVVIQIGIKPESQQREICIRKARDGGLGKFWVDFEGEYTRFTNKTPSTADFRDDEFAE